MSYRKLTHGSLDRMQWIDAALRRGERINCTTVGKVFNVNRQTILGDLEYMTDRFHRPIRYEPRWHAYVHTEKVGPLGPITVSEGEVLTLMIARGAFELYRGTPYQDQLAASLRKLAANLKDKISLSLDFNSRAVSFKPIGRSRLDPAVFKAVSRGVMRDREVTFTYRKPGERKTTRRHVKPYHLIFCDTICYLVGYDYTRNDTRTFALPRITLPEVTSRKFIPPADFDPKKYFASAFGVFGGKGNHKIVLRFRGASADRVREREWHETEQMRNLRAGGLELRLRLGALEEIERWILQWGNEAEVVEPAVLRDRVAKKGREVWELYQK